MSYGPVAVKQVDPPPMVQQHSLTLTHVSTEALDIHLVFLAMEIYSQFLGKTFVWTLNCL